MKKYQRKISTQISFTLLTGVIIGGILVFFTAPDQKISDDQLRLQQELQENQTEHESIVPILPSISDDSTVQEMPKESPTHFTAIGDSVMLGAAPALKEMFPNSVINAAEARQVWEAEMIASELEAQGNLMDTVVIALGANGSFSKKQGQSLLDYFGSKCRIYWIAPYGKNLYWKNSTLEVLQELEAENENLTVLNWPEEAKLHSDWFYDDGMHLNDTGKTGYAQFLLDNISDEEP